jgi:hypothetical protein
MFHQNEFIQYTLRKQYIQQVSIVYIEQHVKRNFLIYTLFYIHIETLILEI